MMARPNPPERAVADPLHSLRGWNLPSSQWSAEGPDPADLLAPVALAIGFLAIWEAVVRAIGVPRWLLPPPSEIAAALVANWPLIYQHALVTLAEITVGFGLAFFGGVVLAVAIARSRVVDRALYPLVVASQTVPVVAIAPLLLIWFGYGLWPKALVVALICFFSIVVNTVDGFRAVDPDLVDLLRTMGATDRQIFQKIEVPSALPYLLSGTKIAVAVSVIGAVIGEWVGAQAGLGYLMIRSVSQFQTARVFACIVVLSAIGVVLFGIVALVERLALAYRLAARRE